MEWGLSSGTRCIQRHLRGETFVFTRQESFGWSRNSHTNKHIKLVPRWADNMQSKVDHLMICSADSFRLNGLFQPRQANIHTHLPHSILRLSLIKIRCGVGTNFITRRVSYRLFCVLNSHLLKPNIPSFSVDVPNARYNQITGAKFKELAKPRDIICEVHVVTVSLMGRLSFQSTILWPWGL